MRSDRTQKMILKYQPKGKKKFRKTFEKMEGFSFVTPVTDLNTGKEDDAMKLVYYIIECEVHFYRSLENRHPKDVCID
jgi:uncharacterized protein with von Willebrand factor type A (vWA) domain